MKFKAFSYCLIALAICLLLPLLGVIPAQSQGELKTWQQATQGMWGADITGIAISPDFANDSLVLVGTWRGLFRSTDAGITWTHSAGLETDLENDAVRFSPNFAVDRTAFTWADNHLYRSTDAGQSWTLYYTASANITALALSPDFGSDQTAILGTFGQGAYITTDGGVTWNPCDTSLTDSFILSAAFSPSYSSDHTLMVGTHSKGFFLSTDSGAHWAALNSGLPTYTHGSYYNISSITPSPVFATDQIIFARVLGYLYRTTDAGATWVQVSGLPLNLVSFVLAPDFATSHKAYASMRTLEGGKYIYTSSDSGANWSQLASNMLVDSIALGTTAGGETRLFGTSENGVARSENGGLTWKLYNEGLDVLVVNSIAVSPAYESDPIIFAVGNSRLFRSTDGAETWSELHPENFLASIPSSSDTAASNQALSATEYLNSVALSPAFASDHTVFVSGERGVYRSQDSGDTWQLYAGGLPEMRVLTIGVSPNYANDQRVFVGLDADVGVMNVYLSEDGGENWLPIGINDGSPITSFVFSPHYSQDGIIFAIDDVWGDLHMSSGDYSVWFNKSTYTGRVVDMAPSPNYPADQTYYTLENGPGIWMTTDDGETCFGLTGFPEDYSYATDLLMSPDFAQDPTFYVSFRDEGGVIRSIDGGDNWQPMNSGLGGNYVEALKFLGNHGDLIAGTLRSGVWVYRAAEEHWEVYLPLAMK